MDIRIHKNAQEMGATAATLASSLIQKTLEHSAYCNIVLATGSSQFAMLSALVKSKDVDWSKVRLFHLDEYLGIDENHPASFRRYLNERFIKKVGSLKESFLIQGDATNIDKEIERLNAFINQYPIDVAMVGIGENAHLAFNDPPADFETDQPYIVVELDEACRKQQLGEGWFPNLEAVPKKAISMSIRQIMAAKTIVCSVPDERKAEAVSAAVTGKISAMVPASILQKHDHAYLLLDRASAKGLTNK